MANDTINKQLDKKYEFGFTTDIEQETHLQVWMKM